MHLLHEFQHFLRRIHQIHIQVGGSSDELQLLKRSGTACCKVEFVLFLLAGSVCLIDIKGHKFLRNMDTSCIAPVVLFYDRVFYLSDYALVNIGENAAPLIHILSYCIRVSFCLGILFQFYFRSVKIPHEIICQFFHHIRAMILSPGQRPKLSRRSVCRVAKFQCGKNSFL